MKWVHAMNDKEVIISMDMMLTTQNNLQKWWAMMVFKQPGDDWLDYASEQIWNLNQYADYTEP